MAESPPSAASLLERCTSLLAGITAFEAHLAAAKVTTVDVKQFRAAIQAEEKSLQKLSQADSTAAKTIHNLRSTNLPFYEAVWSNARANRGLLGLQKRFYWELPQRGNAADDTDKSGKPPKKKKKKKKGALVDIVTEQGLQWIKVSTISETKLLFDKAKAGWEADEWESSDCGEENDDDQQRRQRVRKVYPDGVEPPPEPSDDESDDEYGRIELVRVALDLKKAADATRVHFRHPRVRIVLPNLAEGVSDVVDEALDEIRATGAEVVCGGGSPEALPLDDLIPTLRPDPLTPTLNLDCTILLALISDLSHRRPDELALPDQPHPSLLHQIDIERATPLLARVVYPGLAGAQQLVTSRHSATRMWEIVRTIGTPEERARARLLLEGGEEGDESKEGGAKSEDSKIGKGGEGARNGRGEKAGDVKSVTPSAADRRAGLRLLSSTDVPDGLPLPVEIFGDDSESDGVVEARGSGRRGGGRGGNTTTTASRKRGGEGGGSNGRSGDNGSGKDSTGGIPASMLAAVAAELSPINRSVFLAGWRAGWTTVTSNRVAVRAIEQALTRELDRREVNATARNGGDRDVPTPLIWSVDIARSLVGKEGGRGT